MCEGGIFAGHCGNSDASSLYTHTPGKISSITMVTGFSSSILRHIVGLQAHNSISEDRAHTQLTTWYMCKRASIWPLTDICHRQNLALGCGLTLSPKSDPRTGSSSVQWISSFVSPASEHKYGNEASKSLAFCVSMFISVHMCVCVVCVCVHVWCVCMCICVTCVHVCCAAIWFNVGW